MNLRKCNGCGELKPESEYYTTQKLYKGRIYSCLFGKCKTCISIQSKIRHENNKKKKKGKQVRTSQIKACGLNISDTNYQCVSGTSEYDYVFNNLKKFGNCFISKTKSRTLDYRNLEKKLKKKIITKSYENGYILEVR